MGQDETRISMRRLWEGAQQEILKIGVLQDYSEGRDGETASLQAWMAGDKTASRACMQIEAEEPNYYTAMLLRKRDEGVSWCRVDYVEEPLTPYMKWSYEYLARVCVPAGEKLLQIGQSDVSDLELPAGDVVIVDNQNVVAYRYEGLGRLVGAEVYTSPPDDIDSFLGLKATLLQRATPVPPPES
ncbi:MAG TPA: hypothetical protein VK674_04320 [Candidatus Limnocylindria bacterium]|nr:hypothetical protein [Candidatus Limnocylindria bacterium]